MRMFSWKTRLLRQSFHDGPGAQGHRHPTVLPLEVNQTWWEKAVSMTLLIIGVTFSLAVLVIGLTFAAAMLWVAFNLV